MEKKDLFVVILVLVSFIIFLVTMVRCIYWGVQPYIARRKGEFSEFKAFKRKTMVIALWILVSVFFLRLAVGLFRFYHTELFVGEGFIPKIELKEQFVNSLLQFVNSLLHAFMSFSLDEDFTEYLVTGQEVMYFFVSNEHWISTAFFIYSSILSVMAPLAGGAILLDILAELFPRVRYLFSELCFLKEKYFFTALNEQSLSLAKSIVTSRKHYHSTIVFTDAYADDENEESSERLLRAKALGAICLKDDLMHISINRFSKMTRIFLSDRKENDNLEALAKMLSWKKRKKFKNLEIYVFSSDRKNDNNKVSFLEDEVVYMTSRKLAELNSFDKNKKEKLKARQEKKGKAEEWYLKKENKRFPTPHVIPVNGVRNMAQKLFYNVPLFEGLYGKTEKDAILRLTIFGSGIIGTELFLNAYWMGQMLDVAIDVAIVSQEKEDAFINKIDYLNPEIIKTICYKNHFDTDLLACRKNDKTPKRPYLSLTFLGEKDVMSSAFMSDFSSGKDENHLIDSDYFIIALGSDEDNFSVADKIRQATGYYHLNCASVENKKTVISYVIYNSALCQSLNTNSRHQNVTNYSDSSRFDVYMHAFGSMDEVYSMSNVMFEGIREDAERMGADYQKNAYKDLEKPSMRLLKKWSDMARDYYNYRANIAKRLHIYYKIYSAKCLKPSLFESETDEAYRLKRWEGKKAYKEYVDSDKKNDFKLLHELAWLEHRRWNAFMRICGFRRPENIEKYFWLDNDLHVGKDHKFLMLKLHPCLVESSKEGIHACLDSTGKVILESQCLFDSGLDYLDEVSKKRMELKGKEPIAEFDFKRWDYPEEDKF